MHRPPYIILTLLFVAIFSGCTDSETPSVAIRRLDLAAAEYRSATPEQQDSMISSFKPMLDVLSAIYGNKEDHEVFSMYADSKAVSTFAPDIAERMPDLSSTEAALGKLKANIRQQLPGVRFPSEIYGYITPYNQSIIIADSIAAIGLNHYLGEDYAGYRGYFDNYSLKLKTQQRIPLDIATALISTAYPFDSSAGTTALSRMLYDGALIEALLRTVPDASLQYILGYNDNEIKWAIDNEAKAWNKLAADNLIYSIDPLIAAKLTASSPSTSLLSPDAPGRMGSFIGYNIVKRYIDNHSDITLGQLLSPDFYSSTKGLIQSGYGN